MDQNVILLGDSLEVLKKIENESIDMIYLDPPFFTQKTQKLISKNKAEYSFEDSWDDIDCYLSYIEKRIEECKRVLKSTGSIFLHCDRNASHYLKVMMDKVMGINNFQSEIIWTYRRWSNSKKGLLNNHQVIFFYSKTKDFKFNPMYVDYSETTNVDQILQERKRDENGKSVYKTDENGEIVIGRNKKGVPLSDVWEIPFLNPKAKERVGYPTQKPILLLERIIKLVTEEGDIVLDPFAGSGTTAIAADLLGRKYIGIDISAEAVELAKQRLDNPIKTDSHLLKKGKEAYQNLSVNQLNILRCLGAIPVQRNSGIDGFLSEEKSDKRVSVKIQKGSETLSEAVRKLLNSSKTKKCDYMILVKTTHNSDEEKAIELPNNMIIINSLELQASKVLNV